MNEPKEQFKKQIKRLSDYFNVPITQGQLSNYYDQLYYIPIDAFKDICRKIINDRKPFKSNFPTITQFGPLYESYKPHKDYTPSEFEQEDCQECKGEGLIYYKFWHFKFGTVYTSHVVCAQCRNWRKHYNEIGPYSVKDGNGRFLYRFPGVEVSNRESLCLKRGVLEVPEDGVFRLTKEELSKRIEMFYGGDANG